MFPALVASVPVSAVVGFCCGVGPAAGVVVVVVVVGAAPGCSCEPESPVPVSRDPPLPLLLFLPTVPPTAPPTTAPITTMVATAIITMPFVVRQNGTFVGSGVGWVPKYSFEA